ncbi:MAG: hypothetical protein ABI831_18690, partial [Betaproteobacteria bacterium]
CGFFATNAEDGPDAKCSRCGKAYPEHAAAPRPAVAPKPAEIPPSIGRSANDGKWRDRRVGAPSEVPLPRTMEWADRLPANIRPRELLRSFGRIANQLAATWDDQAATHAYFDQLLVDRRTDRQGFPSAVKAELRALSESYLVLQTRSDVARPAPGADVWGELRKR